MNIGKKKHLNPLIKLEKLNEPKESIVAIKKGSPINTVSFLSISFVLNFNSLLPYIILMINNNKINSENALKMVLNDCGSI